MQHATFAPVYLSLYPHMAGIANQHGYALAAHGSVQRDMDLVAIPWTDDASDPETLMRAIAEYLQLFRDIWGTELHGPTKKPHGRISWKIGVGFGAAIDLSVMPKC